MVVKKKKMISNTMKKKQFSWQFCLFCYYYYYDYNVIWTFYVFVCILIFVSIHIFIQYNLSDYYRRNKLDDCHIKYINGRLQWEISTGNNRYSMPTYYNNKWMQKYHSIYFYSWNPDPIRISTKQKIIHIFTHINFF